MDSGVPISGETYNLTCTVEANVPPTTVQWLYFSNGTAVTNGSNITVWAQRTTDSTTILTLSFNPLHTSHGGQYTCRSTTDTPPSTVNATRNVIVQGECVHIESVACFTLCTLTRKCGGEPEQAEYYGYLHMNRLSFMLKIMS